MTFSVPLILVLPTHPYCNNGRVYTISQSLGC